MSFSSDLFYCIVLVVSVTDQVTYSIDLSTIQVEKRAAKYFVSYQYKDLAVSSHALCKKLFDKIYLNADHTLRALFQSHVPTPLNLLTLEAPFSKTTRFHKSFIRFCGQS